MSSGVRHEWPKLPYILWGTQIDKVAKAYGLAHATGVHG